MPAATCARVRTATGPPVPDNCAAEESELPEGEREALELRVIDELPYPELAARLDIAPAAARLRVSRALRRLAHTVPQEEA